PLLEPVLNFLGSKVSAETMNTLQTVIQNMAMEKVFYGEFTEKMGPEIDKNEAMIFMILWLLEHGLPY
ncbi:MAG: hypothetical protein QMD88_08315, partial [Coprothermobacterota bacterium]|nr:hypothetical protein [Coprothermobacterota bacterium]